MKFFVVIICVFTLLILFSLSYAENEDIETLFEKGVHAFESSNYEDALFYFDKILEIDPSHTNSLINKSTVLIELDRHEEALSFIDKILETDPSNIQALVNKSAVLIELDRHEEALSFIDKILETDPSNIQALVNKSTVLIELDRHEEALSFIDKVLETDPSNIMVLNNKGVLLSKLEKPIEAIAIFDQILEIDPKNANALINRYDAYDQILILSTKDSKYLVYPTIVVRNSNGVLVAVVITDAIKYLPHHLTDQYLDLFPVIENIVIDNQAYEKRIIVLNNTSFKNDDFISNTNLLTPEITSQLIAVFRALHHGIPVTTGDTATTEFTIFRLIE